MYGIFLVLSIIFLAGLFAGLIRPQWIRLVSRKQVALVCGGGLVVFFTLFGMTAPPLPPAPVATTATSTVAIKHSDAVQKPQAPVVPPPAPTAPAPAPVLVTSVTAPSPVAASAPAAPKASTANVPVKGGGPCASAAVATFSKITASYATAYQNGKNALGTTQYGNDYMNALAVPGSAASRFSAWRKTWSAYEPTFYDLIVKGYGTASDCYYNNKQTEPDALANWRDDMGQVDSDINSWGGDATDWQIRNVSADKLAQDAAKITADLATVKADAASL